MSNYNSQLQSNNTDLQAILNTINELPSAGGGSGGGVETCSVTFIGRGISIYGIYVTRCLDSSTISRYNLRVPNTETTIENIVCGSSIIVTTSYCASPWCNTVGDIDFDTNKDGNIITWVFYALTPNSSATVTLYDDD